MGLRVERAAPLRPLRLVTAQQLDRLAETVARLLGIVEQNSRDLAELRQEQQRQNKRVAELQGELDSLQFKRVAQLQADLDSLKHPKHVLTRV